MRRTREWTEHIREGRPVPLPLAAALQAASLTQRAGMWLRLRGKRARVDARVVSFGNLTTGGTGKTPAVMERAAREAHEGRRVAVLTRGYRARKTPFPAVLPPQQPEAFGTQRAIIAAQFGDEAALVAFRTPEVTLVRDPNRVRGARAALREGCDIILLDDGYQAVALDRDENILLIDALHPFGNGFLIPRGILREPIKALCRATEIVITNVPGATRNGLEALIAQVLSLHPGVPLRFAVSRPTHLWQLCDCRSFPLDHVFGQRVRAVCGIARPESFMRTLHGLGAEPAETFALPDHAVVPADLLQSTLPVLVTEKDAMRVAKAPPGVFAVAMAMDYRPLESLDF